MLNPFFILITKVVLTKAPWENTSVLTFHTPMNVPECSEPVCFNMRFDSGDPLEWLSFNYPDLLEVLERPEENETQPAVEISFPAPDITNYLDNRSNVRGTVSYTPLVNVVARAQAVPVRQRISSLVRDELNDD